MKSPPLPPADTRQEKVGDYALAPLPLHRATTLDSEPEGLLARQLSREALEETQVAAAAAHTDLGPPPDGGLQAWLAVFAASGVLLTVFGFVTSMGQLQAYYMENQLRGYSKATVAWLGSIQSMLVYIGSLFAGRAFDAYGPERLMWTGTLLLTGAVVAMGCEYR